MNEWNSLDRLGTITDEMLAGLHADNQMKMRIRQAAQQERSSKRPALRRWAVCCAALALACVGLLYQQVNKAPITAQIDTIAAGNGGLSVTKKTDVADLGDGARIGASVPKNTSLFAAGDTDMPLVTVGGAVYRMLTEPAALSDSLRGDAVGEIASVTQQPSLASQEEMQAGVSNVASEGATVYGITGLSSSTAVAAEVDGQLRVFQRVSYAGEGPGQQTLEDTFDVRGQVKTLELSGVGTLEGQTANDVMDVLLDNAALKSSDATANKQSLTVTLSNGLKLQLGVSGDTLCGCGGWSCPEFFEAFEAAL